MKKKQFACALFVCCMSCFLPNACRADQAEDEAAIRKSDDAYVDDPAVYRFRYGSDIEFVCIDTSKEAFFRSARLFEFPKHWEFIEQSFPPTGRTRPGGFHSRITPSTARVPSIKHALDAEACCRSSSGRTCTSCSPDTSTTFSIHELPVSITRDRCRRQGASIAAGWLRRGAHGVLGHRLPLPARTNQGRRMVCARSRRWTILRDASGHRRFDHGGEPSAAPSKSRSDRSD